MRLVQPAFQHTRILGRIFICGRRRGGRGLGRGHRLRCGYGVWRGRLGCCARLYRSAGGSLLKGDCGWGSGHGCSSAVRNEFVVARSTRPRRHIGRHAAGPMRPVIGNKPRKPAIAATGGNGQAEGKHKDRYDGTLADHLRRNTAGSARNMHRASLTILSGRTAGH
jgi:hypothetical protein